MGATETARELVRVASTAGLAKDVIDLLERKAKLLEEQVAALDKENAELLRENRNLTLENKQLRNQTNPPIATVEVLDELSTKILVTLANDESGITDQQIFRQLGISTAKGNYLLDQLRKKKLIQFAGFSSGEGVPYFVMEKGREYMAKMNLL